MSSFVLQIVIGLQLFVLGIIAALVAKHALAYFKPEKHDAESQGAAHSDTYLNPLLSEQYLHESQAQYHEAIKHSAAQLQLQLEASAGQINSLIKSMAAEIIESEMRSYQTELDKLRGQTGTEMGAIRTEITKYQAELKAKMSQEIDAEKQRLIKQIDTKLADAVGSFLVDTLGKNVDLGSQSSYLVATLEEHKADFIKEVADESR